MILSILKLLSKVTKDSKHDKFIKLNNRKFYLGEKLSDLLDNLFILNETFISEDYRPQLKLNDKIEVVVDIGAYLGDFSIWSYDAWRPKEIIAVEPSRIFPLLVKNIDVNNLNQIIKPVNKAIADRTGFCKIGGNSLALMGIDDVVIDKEENSVRCTTLKDLIDDFGLKVIDVLKIDIEGGERFIFTRDNIDLLKKRVRHLFVEAHDLRGNKKEETLSFIRDKLAFQTVYKKIPWFFGIYRVEAKNPNL